MKLTGPSAQAFCDRPADHVRAALLFGPDAALVSTCRRRLVAVLSGGDDLRLTVLDARDVARDPAAVDAALRTRGFFPGRRVVLIENAGEGIAGALAAVLAGAGPEDAVLVVTAGALGQRSRLRRLFAEAPDFAALSLHPTPAEGAALDALIAEAGLAGRLTPAGEAALRDFAARTPTAALRSEIEKLSLAALDTGEPLSGEMVETLLPSGSEDGLDALVMAVAEGRAGEVGARMRRLAAAGVTPVATLIMTARYFRQLLAVASAPEGPARAVATLRPPVFGRRRQALLTQASRWARPRLETAAQLLYQTDRRLRSPGRLPDRALVERVLIRLAMMVAAR